MANTLEKALKEFHQTLENLQKQGLECSGATLHVSTSGETTLQGCFTSKTEKRSKVLEESKDKDKNEDKPKKNTSTTNNRSSK